MTSSYDHNLPDRLLRATADNWFDPEVEIDWKSAIPEGSYPFPVSRISIYGTSLWSCLGEEEKRRAATQDLMLSLSLGIWTENIVLRAVSRMVERDSGKSSKTRYALVEAADEVRHTVMFNRVADRYDAQLYSLPFIFRSIGYTFGKLMPLRWSWFMIYAGEQMIDAIQREFISDETLDPVVRTMAKIHVAEEARHLLFAKDQLKDDFSKSSSFERLALKLSPSLVSFTMRLVYATSNPGRKAGLNVRPRDIYYSPNFKKLINDATRPVKDFTKELSKPKGIL